MTGNVVEEATFSFECPNCMRVLHIPERYRGAPGVCRHCNQKFQTPPPSAAAGPARKAKDDTRGHRKRQGLFGVAGAWLLLGAAGAAVFGSKGNAGSLTAFSANFTLGVGSACLVLWPDVAPDKLPDWLTGDSFLHRPTWWFAPIGAAAFFLSWCTFSY